MPYWNYRVVKEKGYYTIREVHYNDDGSIYAYSSEPRPAFGESIEELKETLEWMLKSLEKPVLIDGKVKFVNYCSKNKERI